MAYSMTGFGAAEGSVAGGRLRVEIRTVNHRHFNPSVKLPGDLAALEAELRERLRREFDRGHIAVTVRWTEPPARPASGFTVNLERARAVAIALGDLQARLGVPGQVDLAMIVRQPDVISAGPEDEVRVAWADLEPTVAQAIRDCKAMRRREGAVLVEELRHRLALLERAADRIAARAPERLVKERDRLRAAVGQLLDGRPVDEQRLAQELALLADRLDITEELVRLKAHLEACRAALNGDGPVGKQLGFLAQELGREVNTIGAKANDAEIAQQVILMKGELEKFREQLENLE
ncbi:MAG TPA: YicC/YloC family endoribonuclease [Gemmatimonadales bacterium]|nr:YicC/YloC family endoribonuclease [Gemmatimonadales bacterium]